MPTDSSSYSFFRYRILTRSSCLLAALLSLLHSQWFAAAFVDHYSRDKLCRNLTGLPKAVPASYISSEISL